MKKIYFISAITALAFFLSYCCGTRKMTGKDNPPPVAKTNFKTDMAPVIMAHCSPCHIPASGGKKKAYDVYANLKSDIDDIIRRIEMNPGEKGFMPFKKNEKLPESVIALFKKWKTDGLMEN